MLKLRRIPKIVLLGFMAMLAFTGSLYAKDVGRMVSGVWTEVDNPYNVTASLLIPSGETLTIQEGVKIYFKKNLAIKVKGNLLIKGSGSKKVIFSAEDESSGKWYGMEVESGANVEIRHCLIEYASTAIKIGRGVKKVVIDNCVIKEGGIKIESKSDITNSEIKGGISIEYGDNNLIKGNILTDGGISIDENSDNNVIEENSIGAGKNRSGIYTGYHRTDYWNAPSRFTYSMGNKITGNTIANCNRGIYISGGSSNIVSYNVIGNTTDAGMYLGGGTAIHNSIRGNQGYGIRVDGAVKINNNEIYGNTKFDLYNEGSSEVDASNNWWGTSDESEIVTKIFDYFQDAKKGIVNFKPFLKEPPITMSRSEILKIQKRLLELGYDPGVADGLMGAKTKDAIKSFQRDNSLEETGIIDEKTKEKLFSKIDKQ